MRATGSPVGSCRSRTKTAEPPQITGISQHEEHVAEVPEWHVRAWLSFNTSGDRRGLEALIEASIESNTLEETDEGTLRRCARG